MRADFDVTTTTATDTCQRQSEQQRQQSPQPQHSDPQHRKTYRRLHKIHDTPWTTELLSSDSCTTKKTEYGTAVNRYIFEKVSTNTALFGTVTAVACRVTRNEKRGVVFSQPTVCCSCCKGMRVEAMSSTRVIGGGCSRRRHARGAKSRSKNSHNTERLLSPC